MTTRSDLALALSHCHDTLTRAALAIVIETDGSVYRRAGARSVVLEDGRILGVISGGCAEQDLLEHAKDTWETGLSKQIEYDFRSPDDILWGMGAGCNGALLISLLPFDPTNQSDLADRLLSDTERRANAHEAYTAITVLQSSDVSLYPIGPLTDELVSSVLTRLGMEAPSNPTLPTLVRQSIDGVDVELFIETVAPRPHLVVIGAGDDAVPLVKYAAEADWHVTVMDHRTIMNNAVRFPEADVYDVIRRDEYGQHSFHKSTFVVVMTHNYEHDREILKCLVSQKLAYVGVLGPRQRFERLLDELAKGGLKIGESQLQKFHSPVGLDLGAETPEEIAMSILAEAMACRRARQGGFLRDKVGPIHAVGDTKG